MTTEGNNLSSEMLQSVCLTTPTLAVMVGDVGGEMMYLGFYQIMFNLNLVGHVRDGSGESVSNETWRSIFRHKLLMIIIDKLLSTTKLMQQQMRYNQIDATTNEIKR